MSNERIVRFFVPGTPAPQGSKSFKGINHKTGKAMLVESSAKVKPWRELVHGYALQNRRKIGFVPLTGPLELVVSFWMPRPKGAPKTIRTVPAVTPDLSKLVRSTEDALTTAGLIKDDALFVDIVARKRYVSPERVQLPFEADVIGATVDIRRVVPAADQDLHELLPPLDQESLDALSLLKAKAGIAGLPLADYITAVTAGSAHDSTNSTTAQHPIQIGAS